MNIKKLFVIAAFFPVLAFGQWSPTYTPNPASLDAFFRTPTSVPHTIFDSVFSYSVLPIIYEPLWTNAAATVTHLPNESSVSLVNASNSWSMALQTRQWWKYIPGKSQLVLMTAVLPSSSTNANMLQSLGQYSDDNGLYWIRSNGVMGVAIRTKTSGSVVNNIVWQSAWTDKLDGTGASGVTYSFNDYGTIFGMRYQWLGYGRVTFFVVSGGKILPVYAFEHNGSNKVYMSTATLPLRWGAQNTGAITGTNSFTATCASILSEGADNEDFERGYDFAAANTADVSINATATHLISLRPAQTIYSQTNRETIIPQSYEVQTSAASYYEIHYGAIPSGGTWQSADSTGISGVEICTNATGFTAGRVISAGFASGTVQSRGSSAGSIISRLPIALDNSGTNQSAGISIIIRTITGNGTARGAVCWKELR